MDEILGLDCRQRVLGQEGRVAGDEAIVPVRARISSVGSAHRIEGLGGGDGVIRETLRRRVRVLVDRGQPDRAPATGVPGTLTGEPVADSDIGQVAAGRPRPCDRPAQDRVGRVANPLVDGFLVVRVDVQKVGAERELVPDLEVERRRSERTPHRLDDGLDVGEPARQCDLKGRVGASVGQLWTAERGVQQGRGTVAAGRKRSGQGLGQRGSAVCRDGCDQDRRSFPSGWRSRPVFPGTIAAAVAGSR